MTAGKQNPINGLENKVRKYPWHRTVKERKKLEKTFKILANKQRWPNIWKGIQE